MRSLLFVIFLSFGLNAKVLDKIAGVINEKIITLSELKQIQKTLPARAEISPLIYDKEETSPEKILDKIFYTYIIRDKLTQLGYVVSDDSVENRIQMTEKRIGLKREDLMAYLKKQGIGFEEYFEIIRETMELNIFSARIIAPLVSITEQEIKNTFYKRNKNNKTLGFKYSLVDFYLPENKVNSNDIKELPQILKTYRLTGNIPDIYKEVETNYIESVAEENLNKILMQNLKDTDEGSFSSPISMDGFIHTFFVKSKDLKESEVFQNEKEKIKNELFFEFSKKLSQSWFEKEKSNYFIKYTL